MQSFFRENLIYFVLLAGFRNVANANLVVPGDPLQRRTIWKAAHRESGRKCLPSHRYRTGWTLPVRSHIELRSTGRPTQTDFYSGSFGGNRVSPCNRLQYSVFII